MADIIETDISHETKMVFWAIDDFPFIDCGVITHTLDHPMKGRAYRVAYLPGHTEPFVVSGGILLVTDGWKGAEIRSVVHDASYILREAQRALLVGSTDALRNKLREAGCKELVDHLKDLPKAEGWAMSPETVPGLRELTEKP